MTVSRVFDRILVAIAILALWYWGSQVVGTYWLSSPFGVIARAGDWIVSGELLRHASYTLSAAALGFVVGAVPGAVLPFLIRRRPEVTAVLDPYILGGYALPKLALMPLLIIWFGIGIWPKVALVASLTFFLIFFNTQAGIRAVSPQLIRMAEILGANETRVGRSIVFPAALPYIFAGIRISLPFAIGGTVVGEMLSANRGLGYLIQSSAMSFDSTGSFTAIAWLTIFVALINIVVGRSERALLGWRPRDTGRRAAVSV